MTQSRVTDRIPWTTVMWFALIAWLAVLTVWAWPLSRYSPDSWAYWNMAQNIQAGNPFGIGVLRQFQTRPGVAASFPIGYPLILALMEFLLPVGARIGILVNILAMVVSASLLQRRFRPHGLAASGPALILAATLFLPLADEIVSGRAIPMAVMMLIIFVLLIEWAKSPASWMAVGAWAAFGGLIRFDLLPILLIAGSLVAFWRHSKAVDNAGPAAWAVVGSVLVSGILVTATINALTIAVAGEPVPSDNARTVLATEPTYVRDYLPDGVETVLDDPFEWIRRIASNWAVVARSVFIAAVNGIVPFFVFVAAGQVARRQLPLLVPSLILAATSFVTVAGLMLTTSYGDARYWVPFVVSVLLVLVATSTIPAYSTRVRIAALSLALLFALRLFPAQEIRDAWSELGSDPLSIPAVEGLDTTCLGRSDRVMLQFTGAASRLAVVEGIRTSASPSNLNDLDAAAQRRFVKEFGITHIHSDEDLLARFLLETERTRCDGLLRILP
jgi:hypothetical protein